MKRPANDAPVIRATRWVIMGRLRAWPAGLLVACSPALVNGCTDPGSLGFDYDFARGPSGWVSGFADYPVGQDAFYMLEADFRPLRPLSTPPGAPSTSPGRTAATTSGCITRPRWRFLRILSFECASRSRSPPTPPAAAWVPAARQERLLVLE